MINHFVHFDAGVKTVKRENQFGLNLRIAVGWDY